MNPFLLLRRGLPIVFSIALLSSADHPRFEVASVKRAEQCNLLNSLGPGRISLIGNPLKVVLMEAFKVRMDQIVGPSWLDSDCFEVVGKMPEGATKDQVPTMLQTLLMERFKLVSHKENRLRSGYALLVGKKGVKFSASDPGSPAVRAGLVRFGGRTSALGGIKGALSMPALARILSVRLGSPIQDLTGLSGTYNIDFSWATDRNLEQTGAFESSGTSRPGVAGTGSAPQVGDIFAEIQDSLGLVLEGRKVQVEFVIVDSIERVPTEN